MINIIQKHLTKILNQQPNIFEITIKFLENPLCIMIYYFKHLRIVSFLRGAVLLHLLLLHQKRRRLIIIWRPNDDKQEIKPRIFGKPEWVRERTNNIIQCSNILEKRKVLEKIILLQYNLFQRELPHKNSQSYMFAQKRLLYTHNSSLKTRCILQ